MRGLAATSVPPEWGHSRVHAALPLAPAGAGQYGGPGQRGWPAQRLIVDDRTTNHHRARLVGELGLTVMEAEHGQQALDMLQAASCPTPSSWTSTCGTRRHRRHAAPARPARRRWQRARAGAHRQRLAAVQAPRARSACRACWAPIDPARCSAPSAALEGRSTAPAASRRRRRPTRSAPRTRTSVASACWTTCCRAPAGPARRSIVEQAATSDDREGGWLRCTRWWAWLRGGRPAPHARARERYAGWLEGQRPGGEGWTRELRELLEATERAPVAAHRARAERVPPSPERHRGQGVPPSDRCPGPPAPGSVAGPSARPPATPCAPPGRP